MPFDPAQFVGHAAAELAEAVAAAAPAELMGPADGAVELHQSVASGALMDPTVVHLDTLLSTVVDGLVPPDHPPIDLPDVTLKAFLGRGAQGWVYAGKVNATGKTIAVKVIKGENVTSRRSALREALVCAKFCHPNILRVYKVRPAKSFWVVLMELVQGPPLDAESVPRQRLPGCLGQLADAVSTLGEHGIVHRDIKPGNVLIRRQNQTPVLLDFGLAVDLAGPKIADIPEIAGTPVFMTADALDGHPPEPSWDAYALGMTAATVLLGPIKAPSDYYELYEAKRSRMLEGEIEKALKQLPERKLSEAVIALLQKDPAGRLQALEQLRNWR